MRGDEREGDRKDVTREERGEGVMRGSDGGEREDESKQVKKN